MKCWTDADNALLTDLIDQGLNRPEIAVLLDRTMDSVSAQARRLELVRRRPRLQLESGGKVGCQVGARQSNGAVPPRPVLSGSEKSFLTCIAYEVVKS
jgi:hypothetical protein